MPAPTARHARWHHLQTVRLMMMAPDSSHVPPGQLDPATIAALQSALHEYVLTGSSSALQESLTRFADEARERHVLPEHLLIVLKETWNALPQVRAMADSRQQARLLERVISMCIKEYYSA